MQNLIEKKSQKYLFNSSGTYLPITVLKVILLSKICGRLAENCNFLPPPLPNFINHDAADKT